MDKLPLKHVVTVNERGSAIRAVRFNFDGEYCMTCGSDKSVKLWNPYKNILLKTYSGHGYEVLDCASSTDNSRLASCSADKTVVLWDVATGQVVRKYRGHLGRVNCVKFNSPDSSVILSGSYDATVRCWDCRSRSLEPIQIIDDAKDSISSLQVTENEILTGSVDSYSRIYDIRKGQLREDCMGESITSISITNDGQCILASLLASSIKLIDKDNGSVLNSFEGHVNKEYKVDSCVSSNDTHVMSGSEDGCIYFWDLIEAKVVTKTVDAHKGVVYSMSKHPEKNSILTAATDGVKLWTCNEDEIKDDEQQGIKST
ncbi:WD repeat domain-containing protein 83-like [Clytia hemisphaerica]|uniref:WD repeat domain-containing protein 83 n=1 Tax=Clytia hemisphaerica TaxID=252671 RepID=A0A7M5WYS6_9CNID